MRSRQHLVDNGRGWHLSLHQTVSPERFQKSLPPIVIVPGYGMNSYIFGFHPTGVSLEGHLAKAGFEVWRFDLRGQGDAVDHGGGDNYSLADLALVDLRVGID